MFEYAPDTVGLVDPAWVPKDRHGPQQGDGEEHQGVRPNHVSVVGLIEDPHDPFLHGPGLVTGVNAEVVYGRATRFDGELKSDDRLVLGRIVTVDDGAGVPSGTVILVWEADKEEETFATTKIVANGEFRGFVDDRARTVEAHFVPPIGYGECVSEKYPLQH
jgi:hypothetical protein